MTRKLFSLVGLVWCALAVLPAAATPIQIDIKSSYSSTGLWTLSGPTLDGDLLASKYTSQFASKDIDLSNLLGRISGSDVGDWLKKILDQTNIKVGRTPVSVPEPGMLSLLGLGLVAVGFSLRRRGRQTA